MSKLDQIARDQAIARARNTIASLGTGLAEYIVDLEDQSVAASHKLAKEIQEYRTAIENLKVIIERQERQIQDLRGQRSNGCSACREEDEIE